jgi:HPt (histidine-containing phosphotransfer) domain-containing protein
MNDFLTKPTTRDDLCNCVAKWVRTAARIDAPASSAEPTRPAGESTAPAALPLTGDPEVIDLSVLAAAVGRNAENLRRFAYLFEDLMARTLVDMQAALVREDLEELRALGHRAMSSAATVGAGGLSRLCRSLQDATSLDGAAGARALVLAMPPLLARISAVIQGTLPR